MAAVVRRLGAVGVLYDGLLRCRGFWRRHFRLFARATGLLVEDRLLCRLRHWCNLALLPIHGGRAGICADIRAVFGFHVHMAVVTVMEAERAAVDRRLRLARDDVDRGAAGRRELELRLALGVRRSGFFRFIAEDDGFPVFVIDDVVDDIVVFLGRRSC